MKRSPLLILLSILSISLFAVDKPKVDESFAKHSGELQVTPGVDYFIFTEGKVASVGDPYDNQYPFIGFGFGAQYQYRPVEVFGISTGIAVKMHGSFSRTRNFSLNYVQSRTNAHTGFISVPVYFHLYKPMTGCTFEFAVGPDFNFPVFQRGSTTTYLPNGDKSTRTKSFNKLNNITDNASFGLSIFLGGEVTLFDHGNLFIGPQIQFLNLVYFDKDINEARKNSRGKDLVSLGVKLGFRFH